MEDITFSDAFTYHNIRTAAKDCTDGVKWKPSVQNFIINNLQWSANLYKQIHTHTYKSKGFYEFWLLERGKMRFIQSVHISERTVQKCLNNYGVRPLTEPRLIYDNGASRKGKGTEFAIKRLRRHLASHYRRHGLKGGVLVLDIHDYFNSIHHSKLLPMMRKAIADDELYEQAKYFIDAFGDMGLGLGSELSQIAAIYYPSGLDHFIKEKLHIKGYGRYMDDMYLIHEDVTYLKHCMHEIEKELHNLGLELNAKVQIVRFDKGESFHFMKRRFKLTDTGKVLTRLERQNITKRRRVIKRQHVAYMDGRANIESIRQSYQAWRGYALKWDSYHTVLNMDRLFHKTFGKDVA